MAASSETLQQSTPAGKPGKNEPPALPFKTGKLDIVRDRWIYLGLSLLFLVPGIFYIITNWLNPEIQAPVRLGIDFSGGTMLEYGFHNKVTEKDLDQIKEAFETRGYHGTVVQIQSPRAGINDPNTVSKKSVAKDSATKSATEKTVKEGAKQNQTVQSTTDPGTPVAQAAPTNGDKAISTIVYIRSKELKPADRQAIHETLTKELGDNTLLQNYSIGPSLANELLQNGLLALGLAYLLIIGYLTFRFEFDYAVCAIVSLVHDALFVFGIFALLGHFFNTEVDSMFITAILTVVGFSVHDTIVVYDRLRENSRLYFTKKIPFSAIANLSINQTLLRSISTSVTVLLTLLALYLFGGETTKDFIFACLIGIAAGTYSSIFVATSLLVWLREGRVKTSTRAA